MAVALVDSRVGAEAVQILAAIDIVDPGSASALHHDIQRMVVVRAPPVIEGEQANRSSSALSIPLYRADQAVVIDTLHYTYVVSRRVWRGRASLTVNGPTQRSVHGAASAELYDSSTGTFTPTGNMTTARNHRASTHR
jgi:hypothetical protein